MAFCSHSSLFLSFFRSSVLMKPPTWSLIFFATFGPISGRLVSFSSGAFFRSSSVFSPVL